MKLSGEAAPVHRHTPSLPAYEAYLKGRHYMAKTTPEGWARAKEYFDQAIALDPRFGEPHGYLALQYLLQWASGLRPAKEMVPLARAEAHNAVDLYDDGAHAMLAVVAAAHDYDWKEADKRFQIAMAATQATSETTSFYANFLLMPSGRLQEAVTLMEKTVALDPLHVPLRSVLAMCLLSAEMYDRAMEEARKALEIDEKVWIPYLVLVISCVMKGMMAEALAAAEKGYQHAPWNARPIALLAGVLAHMGERDRAEALIGQLSQAQGGLVAPSGIVLYHLICGEIDAAADWFEKAIEGRDPILVPWLRLPLAKPLRMSPRWPKIAAMMNLPETMSQLS